ncbi:MAG: phage integrase family protein [Casimicrobium sp.]
MKTIERISNRLDLAHLALFRGWLHGLDLTDLRRRYLGEEATRRDARETLEWIRSELIAASKKSGDRRTAGLFRRDPQRLSRQATGPTLEEFQVQVDPSGDFYTEAELVALFESEHPQSKSSGRQSTGRLIARQLEAVNALERRATFQPNLLDPVDAWLNPRIAGRLRYAALPSIGAVFLAIEERGPRWWTIVPKLGAVTAERIVAWFRRHEEHLGRRFTQRALIPRKSLSAVALSDGPRALGLGATPCALDKVAGAPTLSLQGAADLEHTRVNCDLDVIRDFLGIHVNRPATHRAYRKEVERFYLWLVIERGRALRDVTSSDCSDYLAFLDDPVPYDRWCSPKYHPRSSEQWRPFTRGLDASSVSYARIVLTTFFTWLGSNGFSVSNPWLTTPKAKPLIPRTQPARSGRHFDLMMNSLGITDDDSLTAARDKFIVAFASNTGLRASEVARISFSDFSWSESSETTAQRLLVKVLGKGSKQRIVDIGRIAHAALLDWLNRRGLPLDPTLCPGQLYLVQAFATNLKGQASTSEPTSVSYGTIYRAVTRTVPGLSPHALRRSFITDALGAGANLSDVQAIVGHSSPATTARYNTTAPADVGARIDEARLLKRRHRDSLTGNTVSS